MRKLVWIGRKVGLGAGRLLMFCRNDEEKVDFRRQNPMAEIVHKIADTQPYFTGVSEMPDFCKGLAEMLSICTRVADMPYYRNRVSGTPPVAQKKRSGLMTTPEKESLEVTR